MPQSGAQKSSPSIPIDTDTDPPPPLAVPPHDAVDFDALNAALGDGSREAAPPPPTPATGAIAPAPIVSVAGSPNAPRGKPQAAESQGASSATYASAKPHTLAPAHVDVDLGAPAVIVADDPVVGTGPNSPLMTPAMPLAPPPGVMQHQAGHPASGPHIVAAPQHPAINSPMGPMPAASTPVSTPQPFPVPPGLLGSGGRNNPGQAALTMRMPERPRRPKSPTVVVRHRGPSTRAKIAVFALMLTLVSVCGLGVVMWRAPHLFGLGPKPAPPPTTPTTSTAPPTPAISVTAASTPSTSASVAPSASAAASASASSKTKPLKPPR